MKNQKLKILAAEVYGGIGNRLLTISSLHRIATKIGTTLEINWVSMPTVIEAPFTEFFTPPFAMTTTANFTVADGYKPTLWHNSRAYIPTKDLANFSSDLMRFDAQQFHHCVWLEQDLESFGPEVQQRLTAEISESLRAIVVPKDKLTYLLSVSGVPATFDLGIHLRVALPDDYRQGVQSVWPDFDTNLLLNRLDLAIDDARPNSCFVASPSSNLVEVVVSHLHRKGVSAFSAHTFKLNAVTDRDLAAYIEFYCLTKCTSIFRRSSTTYSATAALFSASTEYVLSNDYTVGKRMPMIISGHAL